MMSLGQMDSQTCISLLQVRLYNEGRIPAYARTGSYNNETYAALNQYFGPGWDTTPGGACGIYAALNLLPPPKPAYYPPAGSQLIPGISNGTLAVVGAGLLALILVMKK